VRVPEQIDRYIVTVEYEVFADSESNAVRQYFIDKERFLTVRNAKKMETTKPEINRYRHEQDFYDEDGEPVEFSIAEGDDSDILFLLPLDSAE
jgi:hypothetical protein